ncbi:MAG: sigma 54-interacting transcriptional regulator [Spirochaetia bacterium]|jgi:transcriptional regulator with PAS, ATPase and Fis domain|nr:sigma 54-interacting transcriptional regulator [Spirochaetia bacterium]
MSQICYAAYNEDFITLADSIFKKLGKQVDIQIFDPENPQKLTESGFRVILARGGTAMKIRKTLDLPVVEIPIPFEDMIQALIDAGKVGSRIGIVGFTNLLQGLEKLNPLLNIKIKQVLASDEDDTMKQMLKLKKEGIDVFVGGKLQARIAKKLQMNYVRIEFSEKALDYAINEAEALLGTIFHNVRKSEELNAILNHTQEGYIAIDKQGCITLINRIALKLLPEDQNPINSHLTKIFPELKGLLDVLKTGKEKLQEVAYLKGTPVLYDLIPLKLDNKEIIGAIATFNDTKTISTGEQKIRNRLFSKGLFAEYHFEDIKGSSRAIRECIDTAKLVSAVNSTVLIVGETGIGKELFAQSIHNEGSRSKGPFVAVNCASLPESILESELFGYEEGAFTGAKKSGKIGLFELAHNGTIFLDEISEMPLTLQGRFLRVLQERKVMRLGSDRVIPIDVRIISATNKKPRDLVIENKFRADLFFRLNVLTLYIPPLRDRPEDISDLINEFWHQKPETRKSRILSSAVKVMKEYSWPGNIRQLKYFIEKLNIINTADEIDGEIIKSMITRYEPCNEEIVPEKYYSARTIITEEDVKEALQITRGNQSRAAGILQIHRSTLWRLMKKFNI